MIPSTAAHHMYSSSVRTLKFSPNFSFTTGTHYLAGVSQVLCYFAPSLKKLSVIAGWLLITNSYLIAGMHREGDSR